MPSLADIFSPSLVFNALGLRESAGGFDGGASKLSFLYVTGLYV